LTEEAGDLRQRADLLRAITDKVRGWKVTRREAARRLGVTEPCLSDLLAGRVNRFSLEELTALADKLR
jgi:predicted XRE-type DNA-binding protein